MIRYQKIRDMNVALSRVVSNDELISALFESVPELQRFTFVKNQEYDDNNYFDSIRVTSINGHLYSYDGYDDDAGDYGGEPSDLPRIQEDHLVCDLVERIAVDYDFNDNDVEMNRADFVGLAPQKVSKENMAERKYFTSCLSGKKLADSFFIKNDPKYAVYHALDHGRFSPEVEFKIFAKTGEMFMALQYATHVIRGRLPQQVENFFMLDGDDSDKQSLQRYLEEFAQKAQA